MTGIQKKIMIVSVCVALLSSFACTRYEFIDGNHDVVNKTRITDHFDAIVSEGSFEVEYIQDSTHSVVLHGESNLLEYISTEVHSGELTIRKMRNVELREHSKILITCYSPSVSYIQADGSGDVFFDTLSGPQVDLIVNGSGNMVGKVDTDKLYAAIRGSGDMQIRGYATDSELRIEGSGELDAYDCMQRNCQARIAGSGDIFTYVTDQLDARIDGSGDIYYRGTPVVNTHINGSGRVSPGKK